MGFDWSTGQSLGGSHTFREDEWVVRKQADRGLPQLRLSQFRLSRSGRADLAAIYHERIDVEGHHYGPSSPQRKDALKAVDTVLKYMIKWIQVTQSKGN